MRACVRAVRAVRAVCVCVCVCGRSRSRVSVCPGTNLARRYDAVDQEERKGRRKDRKTKRKG